MRTADKIYKRYLEKTTKGKYYFLYAYLQAYDKGNRTEGNKTWDNLFDFNEFYINEFCEFLEDNNCVLFVKLHPAEEKAFVDKVPSTRNIKLITNDLLASRELICMKH